MDDLAFQPIIQCLGLLKQIELAMMRFYALCSVRFPEDGGLWDHLSREEENHALLVDELRAVITEHRVLLLPGKFRPAALKTYLLGAEGIVRSLEQGKFSRVQALYTARDYENTLVESRFYQLVEGDVPAYDSIKIRIDNETAEHSKKLHDHIDRLGSSTPSAAEP